MARINISIYIPGLIIVATMTFLIKLQPFHILECKIYCRMLRGYIPDFVTAETIRPKCFIPAWYIRFFPTKKIDGTSYAYSRIISDTFD